MSSWYEFHLSAQPKSFDLWWWQIPSFKAYFKCNLKVFINLCRIIDHFKATEQNIFFVIVSKQFLVFFFYNCNTKLIFLLWPRSLATFWGVCDLQKSKDFRRTDKWNSYHVLTQNLTLFAYRDQHQILTLQFKGKSLSEVLLFAEHGENMLCTKNVLKQFLYTTCSPQVWTWNFHVLNL